MARSRDISKVLSSNSTLATDAEVAASYQTKAAAGLTLITPTSIAVTGGSGSISTNGAVSFTSASAISLNDIFSATYDTYKLISYGRSSTDADFRVRLRISSSDNSTSNYEHQILENRSSSIAASKSTSQSSWIVGTYRNGQDSGIETIIYSPFNSSRTLFFTNTFDSDPGPGFIMKMHTGRFAADTSFTGLTVYPTSGNFTGSVSIYGYNK
jgi:hypothetical protein